jgi:hypothetical protein
MEEATADVVDVTLCLPEDKHGGVLFNRIVVKATFEKAADGVYYSDRVLFMSARSNDSTGGFDNLQAYINQISVARQLGAALHVPVESVYVTMPEKKVGNLTYNGAPCSYWLREMSGYRAHYSCVDSSGVTGDAGPNNVLGCVFAVYITNS